MLILEQLIAVLPFETYLRMAHQHDRKQQGCSAAGSRSNAPRQPVRLYKGRSALTLSSVLAPVRSAGLLHRKVRPPWCCCKQKVLCWQLHAGTCRAPNQLQAHHVAKIQQAAPSTQQLQPQGPEPAQHTSGFRFLQASRLVQHGTGVRAQVGVGRRLSPV